MCLTYFASLPYRLPCADPLEVIPHPSLLILNLRASKHLNCMVQTHHLSLTCCGNKHPSGVVWPRRFSSNTHLRHRYLQSSTNLQLKNYCVIYWYTLFFTFYMWSASHYWVKSLLLFSRCHSNFCNNLNSCQSTSRMTINMPLANTVGSMATN